MNKPRQLQIYRPFVYYFLLLIYCLLWSSVFSNELKSRFSTGNLSAAAQLTSLSLTGNIELAGLSGTTMILFKEPGNILISMQLADFHITQAYDGKAAWLKDQNGQTMEVSGPAKKQLINAAWTIGQSYLFEDRLPGGVEFYKDSLINGDRFSIYQALPDGGDSIWLFYNSGTERIEIIKERLDEVIIFTYLSDFRTIDGFAMAFRQEAKSTLPQFNSIIEIIEMQANPPLPDSLFTFSNNLMDDYYFPSQDDSVLVNMEYQNGHIFLRASVNGHQPVFFILDSGAGINSLDEQYAESIGIESNGDFPAKGISGYESASITRIDSLLIGDIRLFQQGMAIIDLSAMNLKAPDGIFGGILGYDLISRFPLKVDYGNGNLIFYNPEKFIAPADKYKIDFEFVVKLPLIEAEINRIKGRFLIDLGNSVGLILHRPFVDVNNLFDGLDEVKKLTTKAVGVGGSSELYAAIAESFLLGPALIDKPAVLVADSDQGMTKSNDIDGNIGNMTLQDFSVLFDYANRRIYLLPRD